MLKSNVVLNSLVIASVANEVQHALVEPRLDGSKLRFSVQVGENEAAPRSKAVIFAGRHLPGARDSRVQRRGHGMLRTRVLVLVCALLLSTGATADTVEIDFDFGSSTMNFLGTITIPPDGKINSMSATSILPAAGGEGATSVQTGTAQLKSLMVDMTINYGSPGVARIFGPVIVSQVGTSTGPFTNTHSVMFGGMGTGTGTGTGTALGMSLFVSAHLDCTGLFCVLAGDFPVTIVGTYPPLPGQVFTITLASLNTPGAANVGGTMPIYIPPEYTTGSPFTGTIFLAGTEVSRTYVPEPGSLAQLMPGGVALVALSLRRRRSKGGSQ